MTNDREAILTTLAAFQTAEIGGKAHRGRASIRAVQEGLLRRPRVAGSPAWPTDIARRIRVTEVSFISAAEVPGLSRFEATSASGCVSPRVRT